MSTKADEAEVAKRLVTEPDPAFDENELEALRSIAQFGLGMQAVGRAATVLQSIVKWIGWALALYLAVKAGAIDWIRSVAR